ncbi:MAG: hypothetical protein AAF466_09610 [Bacteroidota bacterium]
MKTIIFCCALLFSTTFVIAQKLDLSKAQESDKIEIMIKGSEESTHYMKPVEITITNTSEADLEVVIPNGQIFHTTSEDVQDVVITREEMVALAPGEQRTLPLYAMCIQQKNSGSNDDEIYRLGPMAPKNLVALTREIEKRKDFNTLGQYAVWTLSDGEHLNSISGFDMEEALHLKTFVAGLMGVPVPEYDPNDYLTNYEDDGLIQRAVKSRFRYFFTEESAVTIAMFDEDNILVRELYNNPNEQAGEHYLEFEYDVEVYTDKTYFVRLIRDEEIKVSMKMEPRQG